MSRSWSEESGETSSGRIALEALISSRWNTLGGGQDQVGVVGHAQVGVGNLGGEFLASSLTDDSVGLSGRHRVTLGPPLPERTHRISNPKDLSSEGDVVARQPVRIPASVPPLVMVAHQGGESAQVWNREDDGGASRRMKGDARSRVGSELGPGVLPSLLHETDHPHVGQDAREQEIGDLILAEPHPPGQLPREMRDTRAMIAEVTLRAAHYIGERIEQARVKSPTRVVN